MIWIVEIYTGKKTIPKYVLSSLVNKFPSSTFYPVLGPYGIYYKGKVPEDDKKDVQRFYARIGCGTSDGMNPHGTGTAHTGRHSSRTTVARCAAGIVTGK